MLPSSLASSSAAIRGLQQAQSAAALRGLNSPVNMSSLDSIYSVNPHASASEMLTSDANAGRATDALINLGGGPQRLGLVNGLDDARLAHMTDESDQMADMNSGVPQAIAQKKLANQDALAAQSSEDAAAREMAPNASALHQRNLTDTTNQLLARYVQPEIARGANEQALQGMKNQGALDVAHVNQKTNESPALAGLHAAYNEMLKAGHPGDPINADAVDALEHRFGIHLDGTPYRGRTVQ